MPCRKLVYGESPPVGAIAYNSLEECCCLGCQCSLTIEDGVPVSRGCYNCNIQAPIIYQAGPGGPTGCWGYFPLVACLQGDSPPPISPFNPGSGTIKVWINPNFYQDPSCCGSFPVDPELCD